MPSLGLIGTVRKNRRELPSDFVSKESDAGSSLFGFTEEATLVSYAPKKNKRVVLLSSEHTQKDAREETGNPEIIHVYNSGKGGVDHLDQVCAAYTSRKRTSRWPKCVFQHMIDVTAYNAFLLWREVTGERRLRRRQFLKMLGAELCGGGVDNTGNIAMVPRAGPNAPPQYQPGSRQRCRICKNKITVQRCNICELPLCIACAAHKCPTC